MRDKLKASPVSAVVLGALMVLLIGGGAATAAKWIDGKRIKPGTVATKQLKNRSVTTAKLGNGAVGTSQLKNGSVTRSKLAPGTGTRASGDLAAPGFLIVPGGGSVILTRALPLGPAGYVLGGYLKIGRSDAGDVRADCEVNRVFRDSNGFQVGSSQELGSPAGNVSGSGGITTLPISGLADGQSPPADAADIHIRVVCRTNVLDAEIAETQLTAIAIDQVIP